MKITCSTLCWCGYICECVGVVKSLLENMCEGLLNLIKFSFNSPNISREMFCILTLHCYGEIFALLTMNYSFGNYVFRQKSRVHAIHLTTNKFFQKLVKKLIVYYLRPILNWVLTPMKQKNLFQTIEVTDLMKLSLPGYSFYKFYKFRALVDRIHFRNLLWLN